MDQTTQPLAPTPVGTAPVAPATPVSTPAPTPVGTVAPAQDNAPATPQSTLLPTMNASDVYSPINVKQVLTGSTSSYKNMKLSKLEKKITSANDLAAMNEINIKNQPVAMGVATGEAAHQSALDTARINSVTGLYNTKLLDEQRKEAERQQFISTYGADPKQRPKGMSKREFSKALGAGQFQNLLTTDYKLKQAQLAKALAPSAAESGTWDQKTDAQGRTYLLNNKTAEKKYDTSSTSDSSVDGNWSGTQSTDNSTSGTQNTNGTSVSNTPTGTAMDANGNLISTNTLPEGGQWVQTDASGNPVTQSTNQSTQDNSQSQTSSQSNFTTSSTPTGLVMDTTGKVSPMDMKEPLQDGQKWVKQVTSPGWTTTAALPDPALQNVINPVINATQEAVYQDSLTYLYASNPASALGGMGLGQNSQVRNYRMAVRNKAGAISHELGLNEYQARALFKANSTAATQVTNRLALIETTGNTLAQQFPRLETLADKVKSEGLNITESDIQAGSAEVLTKFGSPAAASYVELITTVRGDYAAMQRAIGGGQGGEYLRDAATDAIPAGLTSEQYKAQYDTLSISMQKAKAASQNEVQSLLNPAVKNDNTSYDNVSAGSTITYNGQEYTVDANGNMTPVQ